MNTQTAAEVQNCLQRIRMLAKEIEDVPNFGPDMWSMQKIDKKCQEITQLCNFIGERVGTGDAGWSNTGYQ